MHKQIGGLPMATSAELYQLSWVIEQFMANPRRIVQVKPGSCRGRAQALGRERGRRACEGSRKSG